MENNKIGQYGNINDTGEPFTRARVYNLSDDKLLDNIESGIKPLVVALIDVDYPTYSSCEGHHYPQDALLKRPNLFEYPRIAITSDSVENANLLINSFNSFDCKNISIEIVNSDTCKFSIKEGYDIQIRFVLLVEPTETNRLDINDTLSQLADHIRTNLSTPS